MLGIQHFKVNMILQNFALQQNLVKYFRCEAAYILCEQFNKFVNTLKKEKQATGDEYPWFYKDDERRNMSHKEILEKYMNLENSCLSDTE